MAHTHTTRGSGPKEGLLALAIVLICAAILVPLATRQQNNNLLTSETGRMRKVYVALAFYEEQYDFAPAPNLPAAALYDPNHLDYLSISDPFKDTAAKQFPMDPGVDTHETAPFRISFSYIQNFVRAEKLQIKPWSVTRFDPKIGELADEWLGSVTPGSPFNAQVSGRLIRINTDGSIFSLQDRGGPKPLGNPEDLFLKR